MCDGYDVVGVLSGYLETLQDTVWEQTPITFVRTFENVS